MNLNEAQGCVVMMMMMMCVCCKVSLAGLHPLAHIKQMRERDLVLIWGYYMRYSQQLSPNHVFSPQGSHSLL